MNGKYIWLFGENLGATANNNSYFTWDYIVDHCGTDGISSFLVLEKNEKNTALYRESSSFRRKRIVWRNSLKHYSLYERADMLFVTLSYLDVVPDKLFGRRVKRFAQAPVIYLQHGVLGMKKLGYRGDSYNNNMFRFVYYNRNIAEVFSAENDFRPYQLFYGVFQPRWRELVKRANCAAKDSSEPKRILWFVTWREYAKGSIENKLFLHQCLAVIRNEDLANYCENCNVRIRIILHQLMKDMIFDELPKSELPGFLEILTANETDLMDEIATSELLITDYSSVAYDFAFLQKPVILYQPDFEEYSKTREFYCEEDELRSIHITDPKKLVSAIVSGDACVPSFFASALPDRINYHDVADGAFIKRMYEYFASIQSHTITFLGYGFWGIGGTVTSTRSLGEALLERGYAVRLLSLKRLSSRSPKSNPPYGLRFEGFYQSTRTKSLVERCKRRLPISKSALNVINTDGNKEFLAPYAGVALKRFLLNDNSNVIVSTRESFHHAVMEYGIQDNKVCFFHTTAEQWEQYYPGITGELKNTSISKALFTTEANLRAVVGLGVVPQDSLVIGNTLESNGMMSREEVIESRMSRTESSEDQGQIKCITLLRMSEERKQDLARIIEFGQFLKERHIDGIQIDVYGSGSMLDWFIDSVYSNDLWECIHICGSTSQPTDMIRLYDLLIDFSLNQSFGMTYLEAVFNGVVPVCTRNTGSSAVLSGHDELFYETWEELYTRIMSFSNMSTNRFIELYDSVLSRYSHDSLAGAFEHFVWGEEHILEIDDTELLYPDGAGRLSRE